MIMFFAKLKRKIFRLGANTAVRLAQLHSPGLASRVSVASYRRMGMRFEGTPNYLSPRINFDGTDYGLIEIHEGVTISSYVRILTHDWSLNTVSKSIGHFSEKPIGRISGISIGAYSFVGTGSIVMPGAHIGQGCLIGAGTVVRGDIPDYSIVVGSPGKIVGDTREHINRQLDRANIPRLRTTK